MSAVRKPQPRTASKSKIHELALNQINDAAELQPRKQMDLDIMREYSNAWLEGASFPAIDVFFDGETYWLADGFYRVRSARKANLDSIKALVHDGDKRDALLFAVGANATHGVRRSNDDKKKAIVTMLDDPEWCLWSDKEIARACNVSEGSISRYRAGSPGLKGHGVTTRIGGDGSIRSNPPAPQETFSGVPKATFKRPPVMMSQEEIRNKFITRIIKHLKSIEQDVIRDFPYSLGTVEIASTQSLYAFAIATSQSDLYRILGRMMVARSIINPSAAITIIGHFPQSVGHLISALRDMGVFCETPEQVLGRQA